MSSPAESDTPTAAARPLTGGAVIAALSRVSVMVAGVITTVVLARVLGPRDWGSYVVAQSLAAILVAGTTLGVEHGIAYFVSSGRWNARSAFESALRVALVMGLIGAAVGVASRIVAPSAFEGLPVWIVALVGCALPFSLAWLYTSAIALAIDRYEAATALPAAQAFLVLCLAVPAAAVGGAHGAIVGMAAAAVFVGIAATFWGARRISRASGATSTRLRTVIAFGIKGYGGNALQIVNYRLDLFILAAFATPATVGQYGLAVSATTLLWLLPGALSDVLFPRIARLSGGQDAAEREAVETKSLRHATLIVLVTTIALAVILQLLVVPVFGVQFRPTIDLAFILLPGAAAVGLTWVLAAIMVGRGKPSYSLYSSLATTPVTIAMYATLIPSFGATGAAVGSTLSYLASFLISCGFYRRIVRRPLLRAFVPTPSELTDLRRLLEMLTRLNGLRAVGRSGS